MQRANEVRFNDWTLRIDSGELMRDGVTVRLQAQPLLVLQALLEHPGEVIPREDLVARLWPSGIVDFDTALNSAVRRLRHALDDIADAPRYIETIPRRGYRFIGKVGAPASVPASAPEIAHDGRGLAGLLSSREPLFRSAVLTAALLLAIMGFGFGRDSHAPRDPAFEDVVAGTMPPQEVAQAVSRYREARYFYERHAPGDLERARSRFADSIVLTPDSAEAYAGLASTYFMLTMDGEIERDTGLDRVRAAAERAIALDPNLAEAHYRLANYAHFSNDQRRADEERHKAMALAPAGAIALSMRSFDALRDGRVEEAVVLARKAVAAEPLALNYRYNLAVALFFADHVDEAKTANLEALEMSPRFASEIAAMAMILEHDFDTALTLIRGWPDGPSREECLALAYFGLHRFAESDDSLASLIRSAATSDPLRIVEVYAYRGDEAAAFHWLDVGAALNRAARANEHFGVAPWMLRLSPFAAPLRGTPQWNAWLETVNAPASAGSDDL
jgi:DNA-binding winged helix-turn-helix (wHTH) protein/tetratricopeptide (TPR) repeat protein